MGAGTEGTAEISRNRRCRALNLKLSFICFVSALLFFVLRLQIRIFSPIRGRSSVMLTGEKKRAMLYEELAEDLDKNGAVFLKQGQTSQSLSLSDLFTLKDGAVTPILRPADPPVRAIVLHLSSRYSVPISEAVKTIFSPFFDKAIWFQNTAMYHFSMFHAAHHKSPVPAIDEEIEAEASNVKAVAEAACPLDIVLDRVVLTSTGVLLGCWQVVSGLDPATIRARLSAVLPNAPKNQLYNEDILHTTFARLLGPPKHFLQEEGNLDIFHKLVAKLNEELAGMKARVSEAWYVEEEDLLALALNGRVKIRKFDLGCSCCPSLNGTGDALWDSLFLLLVYIAVFIIILFSPPSSAMGASGTESFLKIFAQNFDTVAGSECGESGLSSIRIDKGGRGEGRRGSSQVAHVLDHLRSHRPFRDRLFTAYYLLFFTSWLLIPYFDGASRVYHHFLRPQRTSSWRYSNSNDDGYNAFAFDNKMIHRANRENTLGLGSTDAGRTLYDDSYRYEDDDRY
ncbi:hypothetical protein M569_02238 [Genlisea aurea]|uniref:Uncharacterized protein n=1 Tax=Genlisea aurea TaxID=192259 RepID=S8CYL0_9LAMI|nr:hypothetical protein M569_02238 [Genlisea aurea]